MPVNKTMRITGGSLVRRRFLVPPMVDEGTVRPTPDRVREAVFSMLFDSLPKALVVDLFAGSGAHGYEAISRGAKEVTFVEKDPKVAAIIRQNISDLGLNSQCKVVVADCLDFVAKEKFMADIIFVDPPYTITLSEDFFNNLLSHLLPDGVVIFRCFKKEEPKLGDGFFIDIDRSYAGTRVFVLKRK